MSQILKNNFRLKLISHAFKKKSNIILGKLLKGLDYILLSITHKNYDINEHKSK